MPFKDPEEKKRWMKEWRKQSIKNGYGKWLYQRRALRQADGEYFREALEQIVKGVDDPQALARQALLDSTERWDDLGPAPGGKVRLVKPDSELERELSELDLSSSRS